MCLCVQYPVVLSGSSEKVPLFFNRAVYTFISQAVFLHMYALLLSSSMCLCVCMCMAAYTVYVRPKLVNLLCTASSSELLLLASQEACTLGCTLVFTSVLALSTVGSFCQSIIVDKPLPDSIQGGTGFQHHTH